MSNPSASVDKHLDGVGDGCGCVSVWEALSEYRAGQSSDAPDLAAAATDTGTE